MLKRWLDGPSQLWPSGRSEAGRPSGLTETEESEKGFLLSNVCASLVRAQWISITLDDADRRRLAALVADHNTPQKHVWRAQIVLLSADGVGTSAIMTETGTAKTTVWRWQARFMEEGVEGLLRDKTHPSRPNACRLWQRLRLGRRRDAEAAAL